MIRAAEILGEIKPPRPNGPPSRLHICKCDLDDDVPDHTMRAIRSRMDKVHRRRAEWYANYATWREIGTLLTARREALGLSRKAMAERIGFAASTLEDIEKAERLTLERWWPGILEATGVDIAALLRA